MRLNIFSPDIAAVMKAFNGTHVMMQDALPSSVEVGDVLTSLNWMPSFTAFNNTYRNNRARCVKEIVGGWLSAVDNSICLCSRMSQVPAD